MSIADGFAAYRKVVAEHMGKLEAENAELQATFDLMYSANQRGIKAWRESHPESAMVWPDQSKLVEWLLTENAALKIERNRLRVVLQDIADASGFDNIGNWARNKAKDALRKETKP